MKSIKPGRGPSMMGGLGSIFAGVFGVIWTMAAVQMGAGIFALFGVVFINLKMPPGKTGIRCLTSLRTVKSPTRWKRGWPLPPPLRRRTKSREEAFALIAGPRQKRAMISAAAAAKSCLDRKRQTVEKPI